MIDILASLAFLSQTAFDPRSQAAEAVRAVREMAYTADKVDWTSLDVQVLQHADGATAPIDMLPAYNVLVRGLNDGHSYVQMTPAMREAWRIRHGDVPVLPGVQSRFQTTSRFVDRHLAARDHSLSPDATIRAIVTPAHDADPEAGQHYAATLVQFVLSRPSTTCGYVLDLRGNTGGDMWPMVAGLSPLLGEGPVPWMIDRDEKPVSYNVLREGEALRFGSGGEPIVIVRADGWVPEPSLATFPVAVLIDDGTMSSGEAVALAFKGRLNTRFFGERTYGAASANQVLTLSDGVKLQVTVAMLTDRTQQTHPLGLTPDDETADGQATEDAAQAWLRSRPECS